MFGLRHDEKYQEVPEAVWNEWAEDVAGEFDHVGAHRALRRRRRHAIIMASISTLMLHMAIIPAT
jgi:hypothetical protein